MSRTLLAIISCDRYKQRLRAMQDSWVPKVHNPAFEIGVFTARHFNNRFNLNIGDDYYSLIQKTQALCRWVVADGYDRVLKVDDDCHIFPERLLEITEDYAGILIGANDCGSAVQPVHAPALAGTYPHSYASGGAYWLSRRAAALVACSGDPGREWAEDRFVGHVLAGHGIKPVALPNYHIYAGRFPENWAVMTQIPHWNLECAE